MLNGVFLGLLGAVAVVFAPLIWRAIRARDFDRVSQLVIGIVLNITSLCILRAVSTVSRATDSTWFLKDSPFIALAIYMAILGSILHITAPGMVEARLEHNRRLLFAAIVIGLVIAAVTIIFQRTGALYP